jgi:hypothetical protein
MDAALRLPFGPKVLNLCSWVAMATAALHGATPKNLVEMKGHQDGVTRMAWAEGRQVELITGSWDGELLLWSMASKKKLKQLAQCRGFIRSVSSFDSGQRFVACVNSSVTIGHVSGSRRSEVALRPNGEFNCSAAVSPDGSTVAVSVYNKQVELFSTSDGSSKGVIQTPGGSGVLTYAPDGSLLVTSNTSTIWLYKPGSSTNPVTLQVGVGNIDDIAVSPDGSMVACAAGKSAVYGKLKGQRPSLNVQTLPEGVESVTWTGDSQRFAVSGHAGNVYIFDASSGQQRDKLTLERGQTACVSFSPDGQYLAIGSGSYLDMNQRPPRQKTGDNAVRLLPLQKGSGPAPSMTGPVTGGAGDVTQRLRILRQQFEAARDRELNAGGKTSAVKQVRDQYLANLDKAMSAAAKALRLEEALALKQEKESLATANEPAALPDNAPAELKTLRADYVRVLSRASQQDLARILPLYDRYLAALSSFMDELTAAKRLEEALQVKAEREAVAAEQRATSP